MRERDFTQQRHGQLDIDLVELVATGRRGRRKTGAQARLVEGIRNEAALLVAMLVTDGHAQIAGRQFNHSARDVGKVGGGLGQAPVVVERE